MVDYDKGIINIGTSLSTPSHDWLKPILQLHIVLLLGSKSEIYHCQSVIDRFEPNSGFRPVKGVSRIYVSRIKNKSEFVITGK